MNKVKTTERHSLSEILILITITAILAMGGCAPAQRETASVNNNTLGDPKAFAEEFKNPTPFTQTSIRYWFLTDNATDEQIWKEMKDIADAGFAGVEICNKSGTLETQAWVHMMQTLVQAAEKYEVHVSFTFYNDGPTSVPTKYLKPEASSMNLLSGYTELTAKDFSLKGDKYVYNGKIPETKAATFGFGGGGPGGPGEGGPGGPGGGAPGAAGSGGPRAGGPGGAGRGGDGSRAGGPGPEGPGPGASGGPSRGEKKLVAVTIAKKTGGVHSDEGFSYNMRGTRTDYTIPVKELDRNTLLVVTPQDENSAIDWSIPATEDPSDYVIFSFYSQSSVSKDSAGDGKATVNHFALEGAEAMFAFYMDTVFGNEIIADYFKTHGGSMFEDSLELMGNPIWTANLLEEFKKRRGYELTDKMPVLINRFYNSFSSPAASDVRFGFADASDRLITNDFNELLDTLYQEYHLKPINKWVNEKGMTFKAQAYNGNETGHHDTIQNATIIDIIEGESLAFMEIHNGIDSFRYLAGGAHIGGRQIISDELAAVMGGAYNITVADVVDIANKNAVGGVNQFILHGYPSEQTSGQSWPGYHAFGTVFTDPWEDRQPVWSDVRLMTDYLSRTEMILQTGEAKLDVAIYRDLKYVKMPYINNEALTDYGYSYEFLSPDALEAKYGYVTDGVLAAESAAYRAMVFDNQTAMTVETAARIQKYADAGLPLIFIGKTPTKVPYYLEADANNIKLTAAVANLMSSKNVYQIDRIENLAEKLMEIGVVPAAKYAGKSDIVAIHRNDGGKADYYWLYNKADKAEEVDVALTGSGTPYLLDAWTGDICPIAAYSEEEGKVTLKARLEAHSTCIIAITNNEIAERPTLHVLEGSADYYYYDEEGNIVARARRAGNYSTDLSDGTKKESRIGEVGNISLDKAIWALHVESWSKDENNPNGMVKTNYDFTLDRLTDWTKIKGLETVSGRASYSTSFNLANWANGQGAYLTLELGNGTVAVTRIVINGKTLPSINQSGKVIDAGKYLVAGNNTIEIELATMLYNTVFGTPRYAYGLTGITFTPYAEKEAI